MPKEKKCYQITGEKERIGRIKVIEGDVSVQKMLALAHSYKTSLTVLITSVYIFSIVKHMKEQEKEKPIHMMVPVNLRSFFASASARNFFCMIPVRYTPGKKEKTLKEITTFVHKVFEKELNPKALAPRMNGYVELERNFMARVVPLVLKNMVLKIASKAESKHITSVVTNLGRVSVPPLYQKHIQSFDVLVSTGKMQIGFISYGDALTISFTSSFVETDIIKTFFRTLTNLDIEVIITSNLVEG